MSERKQIFEQFMNNQVGARVPVAFWHHFVSFRDHHRGLEDEAVLNAVYDGQKDYYRRYNPDVVKIMSDGFFGHPAMLREPIDTVDGIRAIQSCGADHPFITEQVKYVKDIADFVNGEVYTFYNIFSPLGYIRLKFEEYDEDLHKFARLFLEDPEAMTAAARRIADDILALVDKLFAETTIDGIYYSVQAVQDDRADRAFHDRYVKPLDLLILERIQQHTDNIMLHICGYGDFTNPLDWYVDYPAKIINWATHNENVSLAEGKQLFGGRPVLGGFNNNAGTELYTADKATIQATVRQILEETGMQGVAIGADCTIAADFDPARIQWMVEAAEAYAREHA